MRTTVESFFDRAPQKGSEPFADPVSELHDDAHSHHGPGKLLVIGGPCIVPCDINSLSGWLVQRFRRHPAETYVYFCVASRGWLACIHRRQTAAHGMERSMW